MCLANFVPLVRVEIGIVDRDAQSFSDCPLILRKQPVVPRIVIESRPAGGGISVGKRPDRTDPITQMATPRDLDALDGVMDGRAQLAVELIQSDDVIKTCVCHEIVTTYAPGAVAELPVWIPLATQPVVADALQPLLGNSLVKHKAARSKNIDLLINARERLEWLRHAGATSSEKRSSPHQETWAG